jgi:tetratricopeptide (TPR) repeat protein
LSTSIVTAALVPAVMMNGSSWLPSVAPLVAAAMSVSIAIDPRLLGEMLLQLNQPEAALKEFEASQAREPNRFRNYLGSAKAAELAGDRAKAAGYYRKLVELGKV